MDGLNSAVPSPSPVAEGLGTILVAGPDRTQVTRLQRELQGRGYSILTAVGAQQALSALSARAIQLTIVIAHADGPIADRKNSNRVARLAVKHAAAVEGKEQEGYAICQAMKGAAQSEGIPVLLIVSVWGESVLVRGVESGADYFLFAPYQEQDLRRALRDALLNGPVTEPAEVLPGIEVIHNDRRHTLKGGRSRLARLGFSVLEELGQSRAALAWSQAEAAELRQQVRLQRQQSRQALIVPEVVQGIAHDFNNLLETVSAAATVLRSGPAQPAPYRDAMDTALAQAGMLVATLQDCTMWEEAGGKSDAFDLAIVVEEVIESALLPLRAPNVRVRVHVEGLPPVWSNQSLLFRTINNLVWNAVQAMPSGGMLSILGYVRRNRVVLEIYDTGVGIAEKDQEKIFSPHFSTKRGHAGVGLFLVRRLVRGAGGEITFASRPGRGSTFALSFEAADSQQEAQQPARSTSRRIAAR